LADRADALQSRPIRVDPRNRQWLIDRSADADCASVIACMAPDSLRLAWRG
jgi:hypothetical protein